MLVGISLGALLGMCMLLFLGAFLVMLLGMSLEIPLGVHMFAFGFVASIRCSTTSPATLEQLWVTFAVKATYVRTEEHMSDCSPPASCDSRPFKSTWNTKRAPERHSNPKNERGLEARFQVNLHFSTGPSILPLVSPQKWIEEKYPWSLTFLTSPSSPKQKTVQSSDQPSKQSKSADRPAFNSQTCRSQEYSPCSTYQGPPQ